MKNEYGKCGHLSFFTSQQNTPDVDIDSRYRLYAIARIIKREYRIEEKVDNEAEIKKKMKKREQTRERK